VNVIYIHSEKTKKTYVNEKKQLLNVECLVYICIFIFFQCQQNVCENGGTCLSINEEINTTCACQTGFKGDKCQTTGKSLKLKYGK
jgi:hypothetical protein